MNNLYWGGFFKLRGGIIFIEGSFLEFRVELFWLRGELFEMRVESLVFIKGWFFNEGGIISIECFVFELSGELFLLREEFFWIERNWRVNYSYSGVILFGAEISPLRGFFSQEKTLGFWLYFGQCLERCAAEEARFLWVFFCLGFQWFNGRFGKVWLGLGKVWSRGNEEVQRM